MQLAMIGLGRMGSNLVRRLQRVGHELVVYDVNKDARETLAKEGATPVDSLAALAKALPAPRTVWVMVPSGEITEKTIAALADILEPGDTVIDGGNSHFTDSVRRGEMLAEKKIDLIDCGTSGGVFGLERGFCLMIGGKDEAVARNAPIFATIAPGRGDIPRTPARVAGMGTGEGPGETAEDGWLHCGPSGAGHYVKMVHNGVEYGIMQAYAEGFALFDAATSDKLPENRRFDLDPGAIAEVWRRGSVISSWLLDLTADALAEDGSLKKFSAEVQDSGEGGWTIEAAMAQAVPVPVLTAALFERYRSRQDNPFGDRLLSAMRFKFGGHVAPKPD